MLYTLSFYFLLFVIYSFCGWILEVCVFLVQDRKLINRGFLIGPYLPIYGFCSVLMTLTFGNYISTPLALFVMAGVVCTAFEYITSYIMEKLFHARWWDYTDTPFNINGRVCLHNTLAFGLLGVLLLYIINPVLTQYLHNMPEYLLIAFSLSLLIVFIVDLVISFNIISKVKSTTNLVLKDNTEEISEKVKEILRNRSVWTKRLIDAFPDLKTILQKQKERIKEQINKL